MQNPMIAINRFA